VAGNQPKLQTVRLITDLIQHLDLPLVRGGDYNEVFYHEETKSGLVCA